MTNILVVEDNSKHLEDARNLLEERIRTGAVSRVDYVSTLSEAYGHLVEKNDYDGVLCDVFFPSNNGEAEEANGVEVGEYALGAGLPFVMVTSTFHHSKKTGPVNAWARSKNFNLIDRQTDSIKAPKHLNGWARLDWKQAQDDDYTEASSKEWEGAYLALAYIIEAKNNGALTINEKGMSGNLDIISLANDFEYYRMKGQLKETIETKMRDPFFAMVIDKYCRGMFMGDIGPPRGTPYGMDD